MADEARYEVIVATQVRRALSDTLPSGAAFAVFEFIDGPLAERPHQVGAPLRAPFERYFRARRGAYRLRYLIDEEARVVTVVDVSHRSDAYRT